jgi:hypothetical protein
MWVHLLFIIKSSFYFFWGVDGTALALLILLALRGAGVLVQSEFGL